FTPAAPACSSSSRFPAAPSRGGTPGARRSNLMGSGPTNGSCRSALRNHSPSSTTPRDSGAITSAPAASGCHPPGDHARVRSRLPIWTIPLLTAPPATTPAAGYPFCTDSGPGPTPRRCGRSSLRGDPMRAHVRFAGIYLLATLFALPATAQHIAYPATLHDVMTESERADAANRDAVLQAL